MEEIRLQKYFTDCGIMSRRRAEAEIAAGNVTVNGKTAVTGQKIRPGEDVIELRGKIIAEQSTERICALLYKPRGYLSSASDDRGRRCVTELVSDVGVRLYPVGRLDMDSDGLLLLTNDGELTELLTHPRHGIKKEYRVRVGGVPDEKQLALLRSPLVLDGYRINPVPTEIIYSEEDGSSSVLRMILSEGRNRQIRRMCALAGLDVISLTRVAIGKLTLGKLKKGEYRVLRQDEISYLKSAARACHTSYTGKQTKKERFDKNA